MITKNDDERVSLEEEFVKSKEPEVIKSNTKKNIGLFLKGWGKDFLIRLIPVLVIFAFLVVPIFLDSSKELDEIVNYEITVDPNVEDGSLDITYDITWKVLDSTSEGPLTWAKIGTPNQYFTATALSDNIRSITNYENTYVRIDFIKSYYQNDVVNFQYKIHNDNVSYFDDGQYVFDFTPAWFTDAKVDHIKINWLAEGVEEYLPRNVFYQGDGYYILEKSNLKKGEKVNFKIKYAEPFFANAVQFDKSTHQQISKQNSSTMSSNWIILLAFCPYLIIFTLIDFLSSLSYDYRKNRGFRSGSFRHYTRPRNTGGRGGFGGGGGGCACACACACAGSGRAGCSQKDFYHTNLRYRGKAFNPK